MRSILVCCGLLLGACSASADPVGPATAPGGQALHGSVPAQALGLPEFAVVDQAGEARGVGDLLGRPHVLWFYPMAGTPG